MRQFLPTQEIHQFLGDTHWKVVWELCREVSPLLLQDDPQHCAQQIRHIGKNQMPKPLLHFQV
jgi:hypothetical protein